MPYTELPMPLRLPIPTFAAPAAPLRALCALIAPVILAFIAILTLSACAKDHWSSVGTGTINADGTTTPGTLPAGQIFGLMPERILIHPLTRIGADAAGRSVLICHIELHDHYEQSAKALGLLRIELYGQSTDTFTSTASPPPSAPSPRTPSSPSDTIPLSPDQDGDERQELVWNIDLSTPESNALFYDDLVTRTYTLSLGNVPDWVIKWSEGKGRAEGGANSGPTLVATFAFGDDQGRTHTLRTTSKVLR